MKNASAANAAWIPPLLAALLAACATRPPDFGGKWQEANRYADSTRAIPLRPAHVFAPSPMDGTLRAMLQRWSREAGLTLQYGLEQDYTLFAGVASIRSTDLRQAAAMLGEAYAAQRIEVVVEGGRLLVRPAPVPAT